jgi:hypothetical protein
LSITWLDHPESKGVFGSKRVKNGPVINFDRYFSNSFFAEFLRGRDQIFRQVLELDTLLRQCRFASPLMRRRVLKWATQNAAIRYAECTILKKAKCSLIEKPR